MLRRSDKRPSNGWMSDGDVVHSDDPTNAKNMRKNSKGDAARVAAPHTARGYSLARVAPASAAKGPSRRGGQQEHLRFG